MTDGKDDIALDRLFQASRQQTPLPAPDFMARLVADADEHMPKMEMQQTPKPESGLWRILEGWAGFAALASTAATGVWIGIALPETVDLPGSDYFGVSTDVSALIPGYGNDVWLEE